MPDKSHHLKKKKKNEHVIRSLFLASLNLAGCFFFFSRLDQGLTNFLRIEPDSNRFCRPCMVPVTDSSLLFLQLKKNVQKQKPRAILSSEATPRVVAGWTCLASYSWPPLPPDPRLEGAAPNTSILSLLESPGATGSGGVGGWGGAQGCRWRPLFLRGY